MSEMQTQEQNVAVPPVVEPVILMSPQPSSVESWWGRCRDAGVYYQVREVVGYPWELNSRRQTSSQREPPNQNWEFRFTWEQVKKQIVGYYPGSSITIPQIPPTPLRVIRVMQKHLHYTSQGWENCQQRGWTARDKPFWDLCEEQRKLWEWLVGTVALEALRQIDTE